MPPFYPVSALTVKQPWASALMGLLPARCATKRVENRTWTTRHRGPLAIHAGLSIDPAGAEALGLTAAEVEALPRGAVLGTVELVDVVRLAEALGIAPGATDDPWHLSADPLATGPFCWIVERPRPFPEPIPARGRLSLWRFSPQ